MLFKMVYLRLWLTLSSSSPNDDIYIPKIPRKTFALNAHHTSFYVVVVVEKKLFFYYKCQNKDGG